MTRIGTTARVRLLAATLVALAALACSAGPTRAAGTVVVSTKPLAPFVLPGQDPATSLHPGFSIELWRELSRRLGVTTRWQLRENVDQILADVESERADAAIAGISITADRERKVDFSHPYFDSGLQVLARTTGTSSFLGALGNANLLKPIAVFVLLTVAVAHVIWLVERRHDEEFPRAYLAGIWEGLWWSLSNVTIGSEADKRIHRTVARLVAMAWMVVGLFVTAWLTASVTASLTLSGLKGTVAGVADLPGKKVVTVAGTTADAELSARGIAHSTVARIDDAYALLDGKRADAIVFDSPVLKYHVATTPGAPEKLAGGIFSPDKYGIALPEGSALRQRINEALLEALADGTYDRIYAKYFGQAGTG